MRRSLGRKILLIISGLVAVSILICWILNYTVLEQFYISNKQKNLIEAYNTISAAGANETLEEDSFRLEFENMGSNWNLKMLVITADGSVVLTSENDTDALRRDFADMLFSMDYQKNAKVLVENDYYQITRNNDERLGTEYLSLWGTLSNGNLLLIRTPVESIRESVKLSNRFLLIAGLLVIAGIILAGSVLTRRITRPILELTDISTKMVDLDFSAKYDPESLKKRNWREQRRKEKEIVVQWKEKQRSGEMAEGDEIDLLGDHINQLSSALETTISELKSANLKLQSDIEEKIQIDDMRKEFLSNVSHELKTPLALIQGYAEGLKECVNDDDESRDFYCDVIVDEADKMNTLVKKLLTLNQLEFGNEQVSMERFDISELIRGVAGATAILREQKGIALDLEIRPEAYVWADEFKVEEVLTNYMSNAINHCEGEKQIRIFYTEMPGDLLRISVYNTGKQIPEEDLENIWVKFFKVDKAHTRSYGGSGIGLSIVKAIMDSFRQNCGVINHPDGVEFWFELSRK